jgi:hypothetical protein
VTYIKTQSLPEGTFKRKKKKHLQGDRPPAWEQILRLELEDKKNK